MEKNRKKDNLITSVSLKYSSLLEILCEKRTSSIASYTIKAFGSIKVGGPTYIQEQLLGLTMSVGLAQNKRV